MEMEMQRGRLDARKVLESIRTCVLVELLVRFPTMHGVHVRSHRLKSRLTQL